MTRMTSFNNKKEHYAGSSVKGQNHKKLNLPNQDSYLIYRNKKIVVLAIADGLGSHKYSKVGSKAVVKAVKSTFIDFENGGVPFKQITSTIYNRFVNSIPKKYVNEAATTCAFVVISEKNGVFAGQVGDGLCYLKINDSSYILKPKTDEFSNIVTPLNPIKENVLWKTKHFNIESNDEVDIMLATDGISEDIIPGKEDGCLEYCISKTKKKIHFLSNMALKKIILNWNVPGSLDDKSIVIYSRRTQ